MNQAEIKQRIDRFFDWYAEAGFEILCDKYGTEITGGYLSYEGQVAIDGLAEIRKALGEAEGAVK